MVMTKDHSGAIVLPPLAIMNTHITLNDKFDLFKVCDDLLKEYRQRNPLHKFAARDVLILSMCRLD
jgi:hypothetical protein